MTYKTIKIQDDVLEHHDFEELSETMIGSSDFPWHYNDFIDLKKGGEDGKTYNFQFTHMFFFRSTFTDNSSLTTILPILRLIEPITLIRIKANLLTKTPKIVENEFHVDMHNAAEKLNQLTTSILYINTNNGYTEFEDGTKVESVANRMVTFPADMNHRGTSCTDENIRAVINFNYLK
jgi:hypothetical protein